MTENVKLRDVPIRVNKRVLLQKLVLHSFTQRNNICDCSFDSGNLRKLILIIRSSSETDSCLEMADGLGGDLGAPSGLTAHI